VEDEYRDLKFKANGEYYEDMLGTLQENIVRGA
jgi:hypothetical protein